MTKRIHILRNLLAGGLAIAGLGMVPSAGIDQGPSSIKAQSPQGGAEKLSKERAERMEEIFYADDEPVRLGGRLRIQRCEYANGIINAEVLLNWRDNRGAFIPGVRLNFQVLLRAVAANSQDTTAFRDVARMTSSAVTNQTGVAAFRLPTPLPEKGLIPGEYYLKFQFSMVDQSEEVKTRLMSDTSMIYEPALIMIRDRERDDIEAERRNYEEARRQAIQNGAPMPAQPAERTLRTIDQIRSDLRQRILRGEEPVNPTQYKLFVGTKEIWLDDGTLAHIATLDQLGRAHDAARAVVEGLEIDMRNARTAEQRADIQARLETARGALSAQDAELARRGGTKLTAEELAIRQRVTARRKRVLEDIYSFEDAMLTDYITLLYGDLSYWYWKGASLYGNTIWGAVKNGKLPWEDTARELTYGPTPERQTKVTDLRTWRAYTIEKIRLSVNGDPKTWPENGYTGPQSGIRRGHLYSPALLAIIERDVNAFDPMKYLTKVEADATAGTAAGYVLREDEWMRFEEQFRVEMGFDERTVDPQVTRSLRTYATTTRNAMSTGDRLRGLNLSTIYGMSPTRFPVALDLANRTASAVAYLPMNYRYWIYVELEKLSGQELQRRLGGIEAFPAPARKNALAGAAEYTDSRNNTIRQLERYDSFRFLRLRWAYTEGQNRNWPKETCEKQVSSARTALAKRSDPRAIGDGDGRGEAIIHGEGDTPDSGGG